MSILSDIEKRSGGVCELCDSEEKLQIYKVPPKLNEFLDECIHACFYCVDQIEGKSPININHWRCLNNSMWSEHNPVKVVTWRMLNRLKEEQWPMDLLELIYLDDNLLDWARATGEELDESEKIIHRDSVGIILKPGDNVLVNKDLKVKGSTMVVKQGTIVKDISLDQVNETYIEGKVNGQKIVILTEYVKKSS